MRVSLRAFVCIHASTSIFTATVMAGVALVGVAVGVVMIVAQVSAHNNLMRLLLTIRSKPPSYYFLSPLGICRKGMSHGASRNSCRTRTLDVRSGNSVYPSVMFLAHHLISLCDYDDGSMVSAVNHCSSPLKGVPWRGVQTWVQSTG